MHKLRKTGREKIILLISLVYFRKTWTKWDFNWREKNPKPDRRFYIAARETCICPDELYKAHAWFMGYHYLYKYNFSPCTWRLDFYLWTRWRRLMGKKEPFPLWCGTSQAGGLTSHQCFSLHRVTFYAAPEITSTALSIETVGREKLVSTNHKNNGRDTRWTRGCCDLLCVCCSRNLVKHFHLYLSLLSYPSSSLLRKWMS